MIRIPWEIDEAVVLYDLYFRNGKSLKIPNEEIDRLTSLYHKRATALGLSFDEKFRNRAGLKRQLGCIQFVETNGKNGNSHTSKLFYETHDLYKDKPEEFNRILREFYKKYDT